MGKIVEVNDLTKTFYTKDGEIRVLDHINFHVEEGEIFSLLGPSGSGKSTILNILTKLLEPTEGTVTMGGTIGYMFQRDNLLDWRTIMDNITIGLEILKMKDKASLDRIERLLKTYGLWDFRNMYPKELSGGMRQRVALIRTLAVKPKILLLDEAFSALDYQTRIMVTEDIYSILRKEKITALIVTHDISEAISMSDRVLVLSKRPGTIKDIHKIDFEMENRTPINCRQSPKFSRYFDCLWKELGVDEK